jgi:site-specific DNA-methyltransferase (adenine-specific)
MNLRNIINTKSGRQALIQFAAEAATGIEKNWQETGTPEWVVREMVAAVPEIQTLKRILVLFNIEFLECLIKELGIDPATVDFGYDSDIEGAIAERVYGAHAFSIGKSLLDMQLATSGNAGVYDVVFSNPPYQEQSDAQKENENNTSVAQPIYHKIVEYTIDELKPKYVCMITPSRWMAGGKGLDSYRERMLNDKRFRSIQDFPGAYDIFTSVKIDMGVSYFVWDRDYNDQCEFNGIKRDIGEFDILVRNNTSHQIVKKVLSKHNSHFCNEGVFSTKPFGLPSNFSNWSDSVQDSVKCICRNRVEKQVICGAFTDEHGIQSKWKVCTPAAYGEDTSEGSSVYNIKGSFLLAPGTICTETYIVIGVFITEKEANAYLFYANTKFYRFMVGLRKSSQRITKDKFSWVPDLGDYSKAWTDTELYQHFGLTKKEQEHMEKSIKPLN